MLMRRDEPTTQKQPLLEDSDAVLPDQLPGNAAITFNSGFRLFKSGACFYTDADGNVSLHDSLDLYNVVNLYTDEPPFRRGTYNSFYHINEDVKKSMSNTTIPLGGRLGLRVSSAAISHPYPLYTLENMWEEAWATLHAAAEGLHPRVYLFGLIKTSDNDSQSWIRAAYVTERYESLFDALQTNAQTKEWGAARSNELNKLIEDMSNFGLIHTDIKPKNVVIDDAKTNAKHRQFMIIDLGGDFVRLDRQGTIDRRCIQLINTLLMTITTFCDDGGTGANGIALTTDLRSSLSKLQKDRQKRGKFNNTDANLCNLMVRLRMEDSELLDKSTSFFRNDNYELMAKHIIAMADHYAIKSTDPSQQCAPNENWREIFKADAGKRSVYEVLLSVISERIKMPNSKDDQESKSPTAMDLS